MKLPKKPNLLYNSTQPPQSVFVTDLNIHGLEPGRSSSNISHTFYQNSYINCPLKLIFFSSNSIHTSWPTSTFSLILLRLHFSLPNSFFYPQIITSRHPNKRRIADVSHFAHNSTPCPLLRILANGASPRGPSAVCAPSRWLMVYRVANE